MNLIAAVDRNWGIGLNHALLVQIPEDMKRFRQITTGNVVVMGRRTLESFPGGQPLKDRANIVVTADRDYQVKGAVCVHSMEELTDELGKYDSERIYIIGGESIYRQLLAQCDTALITKINYEYQADAWFPNLDQIEEWVLSDESDEQTYFDLEYYFQRYERKRR